MKRPVSPPIWVATVQLAGHGCFTSVGLTEAEAQTTLRRALEKYHSLDAHGEDGPRWVEQAMESVDLLDVSYGRALQWQPGDPDVRVVHG